MRTISEIEELLGVQPELINSWVSEFSDHLSEWAQPEAGRTPLFTEADTLALALVHHYWEDDPDLEDIHESLNTGEQNERRFVELVHLNTPIFQDVPGDLDETWNHGVLLNSMWVRPPIEVARTYKDTADKLVEQALSCQEPHPYDYPILFNYRHVLELYLKIILDDPKKARRLGHDLVALVEAVETKLSRKASDWVRSRLREFSEIDPSSDLFRYADKAPQHPKHVEIWIDFRQVKTVMDRLCEAFEECIWSKIR